MRKKSFGEMAEVASKALGIKMMWIIAYNLHRGGINTMNDLLNYDEEYLFNLKGIGKASIKWIEEIVGYYGHELKKGEKK